MNRPSGQPPLYTLQHHSARSNTLCTLVLNSRQYCRIYNMHSPNKQTAQQSLWCTVHSENIALKSKCTFVPSWRTKLAAHHLDPLDIKANCVPFNSWITLEFFGLWILFSQNDQQLLLLLNTRLLANLKVDPKIPKYTNNKLQTKKGCLPSMVGRWPASKVARIRPRVIQAKQAGKQASAYQSNAIHIGQVQKKSNPMKGEAAIL